MNSSADASNGTEQVERLLLLVWQDLRQPDLIWQAIAIAVAIGIAWLAARQLKGRVTAIDHGNAAVQFGIGGLKRVLWPSLALVLVLIARSVLARDHHVNLLNVAAALLGSMVVVRMFVYAARTGFPKSTLLAAFERTLAVLVWSVFALHITGVLPELIGFLERVSVAIGKQTISLWTVLTGAFWVMAIVLVALWLGAAIDLRLMQAPSLHSSLRVALSRVVRALLVIVGVLVALPIVGIDLTVLSVFGGALGVGIGFGLQKIASNYMSGFIILLDRSVRIGDMVTVDNFQGEVRAITTRYVVVRSLDGREAIVPNEKMIIDTVLNHSFTDARVRVAVQVPIGYRSDLEQALRVLEEIAAAHPRIVPEPKPVALVLGFADSGINLECGFWIADPQLGVGLVRSDINRAIWRRFRELGIEIPYPQRDIRLIGAIPDTTAPGRPAES